MEKSLECFCGDEQAVPAEEMFIDYSSEFYRKCHSRFDLDIDKLWAERIKENINLFDKSKFRYHGHQIARNNEGKIIKITLQVGLTSYKDFIGTNMSPVNSDILQAGISDHNNCQAYMADPIGVGALVQTSDDYFVFLERSETVAEAPGKVCRPGGHPEPDEITNSTDKKLELIDPSLIAKEIYDSTLKEIRDELNIPIDTLSAPLLLGIGFNPETANRPSLEFFVRCSLSSKDVQEMYAQQTQLEKDESKCLKFVSKDHLLMPCLPIEQKDFWDTLTHAAQCAILLFSRFSGKSVSQSVTNVS